MKIAMPVKTNKENPALAPLFGKAKWFAFVEDGKIEIKENPYNTGTYVAKWLVDEGVDALIFMEMGQSPYELLKETKIKLYHAGFDRILLLDAIDKFNKNELKEATNEVMADIIKHHEGKHGHHGGHGKHHH